MDPVLFIRAAYWLGAALDAWLGLQLLFPRRFGRPFGIRVRTAETRYALWLCAGATFGWTGLLVWGSLLPIERRFLLLLTVFPVMLGLLLANLGGYRSGYLSLRAAVRLWISEGLVVVVFLAAYTLALGMVA